MTNEAKVNLDNEKALLRSKGYDVDCLTGKDYENASAEEQKMMDSILLEQYRTQDPYERVFGKDWKEREYDFNLSKQRIAQISLDIEKAFLRNRGYNVECLTDKDYGRASAEEKKMMDIILTEQYYTQDPYERVFGKDWKERAKYDENGNLIWSSLHRPMPKELLADWEKALEEALDDDF